jgi:regulator of RNase E activity RraA
MKDAIARLRALDTCAVSDALDRHGIRGAVAGLLPLAADRQIAGRAVTVALGPPPSDALSGQARHLGTAAVDASRPGDVIVVAHQGRTDCAGWGGLLSRAAAARGIDGVIIDGAARDLTEAAEVGLAVYARMATPVTARGRAVELAWGEPVEVAGVTINPGDLVLADRGGVAVIPVDRAHEVLATAETITATEAAMAEAITAGTPVSDVMGKSYEELTGGNH